MEMTLAKKANQIEYEIIQSRGKKLFDQHGLETGKVIRAMAVSRAKQALAKEQPTEEQPSAEQPEEMNEDKLREMVRTFLSKPLEEKKGKDMDGDGDIDAKDYLMARDIAIKKTMQKEDLDLGHQDDEPHMIKGELYKIAQNAIALYKMLEPFDKLNQEVDLPAWWQGKITKACTMLGSAKNYLEFELKEPQIDAATDAVSLDEKMTTSQKKKRGEIYDALKAQGMSDEKAGRIATSKAMKKKIKEAILAQLNNK
jgi:hypothetical protein